MRARQLTHGRLVLVLGTVLAAWPSLLEAQTQRGADAFAVMASDSVAWQRVLAHVVERLSVTLLRAAVDPAPQPWTLRLPSDEPQRALLDAQLRTVLRARVPVDRDSVVRSLTLGPLRLDGDTARVSVRVDETYRCPGSTATTGSGWAETVIVTRHPPFGFWGAAFSRSVLGGDRVSCPRPPR